MEVDKKEEIESGSSEQVVVTPWEVSAKEGGKIDYDKLIDQFGCQRLDESMIDRVQRLTSRQPHVFLRRGVFFAHRFETLANLYFCELRGCANGIAGYCWIDCERLTGISMRFWMRLRKETSSISTLEEDLHQKLCI